MAERWLSVHQIAAHLEVNPDTIYKWITRNADWLLQLHRPAHQALLQVRNNLSRACRLRSMSATTTAAPDW